MPGEGEGNGAGVGPTTQDMVWLLLYESRQTQQRKAVREKVSLIYFHSSVIVGLDVLSDDGFIHLSYQDGDRFVSYPEPVH